MMKTDIRMMKTTKVSDYSEAIDGGNQETRRIERDTTNPRNLLAHESPHRSLTFRCNLTVPGSQAAKLNDQAILIISTTALSNNAAPPPSCPSTLSNSPAELASNRAALSSSPAALPSSPAALFSSPAAFLTSPTALLSNMAPMSLRDQNI
jgi:hypothetical protein